MWMRTPHGGESDEGGGGELLGGGGELLGGVGEEARNCRHRPCVTTDFRTVTVASGGGWNNTMPSASNPTNMSARKASRRADMARRSRRMPAAAALEEGGSEIVRDRNTNLK